MTNAVSRAARERMARTGEPYTLARRMVIEERAKLKAGQAEPEIEVTPENAQQPVGEGKITINRAREVHGLKPYEPPAALEPFFAFSDEHGEFLSRLFGPAAGQPSSGPPYTHVHRLPETEEEMAAAPLLPSHTITRESE